MRIIAENWENNSNEIKELENRIIANILSIIVSSLIGNTGEWFKISENQINDVIQPARVS